MRRVLLLVVLASALLAAWLAFYESPVGSLAVHTDPGAPEEKAIFAALGGDAPLELFSIQPGEVGPGCQHAVLGSVLLKGAERQRVAEAVSRGIRRKRDRLEAGCFNPHHGIVIDRFALIICYECAQVYCWKLAPGEKVDFNSSEPTCKFLTTSEPDEVLNQVLTEHRIPLGKR